LSVFSLGVQPLSAGFSRMLERQADVYGLKVIQGLIPDTAQTAAHAFQKLGEKGLTYPDPNPLQMFWVYTHPPGSERVRFALQYRPGEERQ
jgi:Zn-dependent protease with chaperone function